jgi:uncharacterized protein
LPPTIEGYLDIETTGLSPWYSDITVIGIHLCRGAYTSFIQLVGDDITSDGILLALDGVDTIYTYNGARFDLPFIHRRLGLNLEASFRHCDLMYHCWRCNLRGGFKAVERQLGIDRRLTGVDGYQAVRLWWRYVNSYDQDALSTLLEYNKEDVLNLRVLKSRLIGDST